MTRQLLLVDDDEGILSVLEMNFSARDITCTLARNGNEALAVLRRGQIHLMVTDLDMPEMDGLTLMRTAREKGLCTRSIVLSGYATIGNLTACLQEGALEILPKPLPSFDLLNRAVDRAFEQVQGWADQMNSIVRLKTPLGVSTQANRQ